MPIVAPPARILVTGGSGFVGSWIVKGLLDKNFNVRVAVRNQAKADLLKDRFQNHSKRLEFALVKDFSSGAFFDAIKDVSGVIHTASPLPSKESGNDPQEHITPAVQGTLEVLKSASMEQDVKRVVVTSAAVNLFEPKARPFTYTEDIWNETALKTVKNRGGNASPYSKYTASKILAERAAWEWMESKRPSYDLVTLLPTFIWGPIINQTTERIRGSNDYLLAPLKKAALETHAKRQSMMEIHFVDVRDVAELHVRALLAPEAGGQRIIIAGHTITWQHIFDILCTNPVEGIEVPRGNPVALKDWKPTMQVSREKSESILNAHYRPADQTIRDVLSNAVQIGWRQT